MNDVRVSAASGAAGDELALLIAEQEKDAQWGHRVDSRGPSLDFAFEGGGTFGEIVGYQGAGGDTAIRKVPRPQKWSRRSILKHIRGWTREHGTPPRFEEWRSPRGRGFPSAASVARQFGTFNAAIEAAGFQPLLRGARKHPVQGTALRPRMRKQKRTARLRTHDLAKAYVLYERGNLSVDQLAERLWERYGYPSAASCRTALLIGFHAEGFKVRSKRDARLVMPPERRRALSSGGNGRRLTHEQRGEIRARLEEPLAVLAAEFGVSCSAISYYRRKAA